MKTRILLPLVLLAASPLPAQGQLPGSDVVDRLLAVVGDSVVLYSQVEEQLQRLALEGAQIPPRNDPGFEEFYEAVLDGLVNRLLVLQAAEADSLIQADEEEIAGRVQERLDGLADQLGGQPQLRAALVQEGLSLAAYRDILLNEARMEQLQSLYYQSRLAGLDPAEVSEDELLDRFQEIRSQLPQRPKLITFRQLVLRPIASEASREAARTEAEDVLARALAGEDFAELAAQHSDEPGAGERGGDLGWFQRGDMVRPFENAAFALRDGQISPAVVETEFGYHVIKVERTRISERQARHVLVIPEVGEEDLDYVRGLAATLRARVLGGTPIFDLKDGVEDHLDGEIPDSLTIPFEQIAELTPEYVVLQNSQQGDVIGPLDFQAGPELTMVAVVEVVEIREAGAYTFEDYRPSLAGQIQQEKQLERLIEELKVDTHIDIRR